METIACGIIKLLSIFAIKKIIKSNDELSKIMKENDEIIIQKLDILLKAPFQNAKFYLESAVKLLSFTYPIEKSRFAGDDADIITEINNLLKLAHENIINAYNYAQTVQHKCNAIKIAIIITLLRGKYCGLRGYDIILDQLYNLFISDEVIMHVFKYVNDKQITDCTFDVITFVMGVLGVPLAPIFSYYLLLSIRVPQLSPYYTTHNDITVEWPKLNTKYFDCGMSRDHSCSFSHATVLVTANMREIDNEINETVNTIKFFSNYLELPDNLEIYDSMYIRTKFIRDDKFVLNRCDANDKNPHISYFSTEDKKKCMYHRNSMYSR